MIFCPSTSPYHKAELCVIKSLYNYGVVSFAAFCDFSYFEEVHPLAQNRRGSCIKPDFKNSKHIVVYKYFKGMVSLLNHIFKMCITVVSFYNLYTRKR